MAGPKSAIKNKLITVFLRSVIGPALLDALRAMNARLQNKALRGFCAATRAPVLTAGRSVSQPDKVLNVVIIDSKIIGFGVWRSREAFADGNHFSVRRQNQKQKYEIKLIV